MLIDTHAHLFSRKFDADREAMVARARQVCSHIFLPNVDLDTIGPMNELADSHPGFCFPMLGIHPCDVAPDWQAQLDALEIEFGRRQYYGVGETGLDLHWDKTTLPRQTEALMWHAEKAKALNLPIILHAREAFAQTADVMQTAQDGSLRGIFHCWVDGLAEAHRALDLGFHLGIGGVATYKSANHLHDVLRAVPRDRVVLETDAPYLAPVPHRGQRNESAYVTHVAVAVAAAWGCTTEEVAEVTSANARALFFGPEGV